ncbi:MAG: YggS family pyridoxal phosphate-dependent enzyme [Candidatus Cloacimonadota bacterium]|nr:MAG: YggS family pyridoxal phosphate-dependent enzyme [Candidatus Cloacimonadota bacterium]
MIRDNVIKILDELPANVKLVAAVKTRNVDEILEAISGGVNIIGENYIQEAQEVYEKIGNKVNWHFIGHLQRNKVKFAVKIFDMIETVDSLRLAQEIDKQCQKISKVMPILIEINSGEEPQKSGVIPCEAVALVKEIAKMSNIKVMGLMTMGPMFGNPEDSRPYFRKTKQIYENIKSLNIPNVQMKYLSMGMTHSYKIAIEQGANIVRIGTKIFGKRI